jgi:AcrR family transcriptional regulator
MSEIAALMRATPKPAPVTAKTDPKTDRRVARTRAALKSAFNTLFLERGYDGFSVGDIAARADVGRSTFYEHYAGKDAILGEAITPLLLILAEAGTTAEPDPRVTFVVQHFWDQRRRALAMTTGGAWTVISRLLAELIEVRLNKAGRARRDLPALPRPLAASLLARAQLGLIEEWLAGHKRCSAQVLAQALHTTTRAVAEALAAPG